MSTEEKQIDWDGIAASDKTDAMINAKAAPAGAGAKAQPLPDLPRVLGRLPIDCGTKRAIIELPEATPGVSCAALTHNVSVVSECGNEAEDVCLPYSLRARPLNDRQIEVVLSGKGDKTVKGAGWTSDPYGGQLATRSVEPGQPFVEVEIITGRNITCGCDSENWADDNGWPQ